MASFIFDTYYPKLYLFYFILKSFDLFFPIKWIKPLIFSEEKYDILRKYTTLLLVLSPNSPEEVLS